MSENIPPEETESIDLLAKLMELAPSLREQLIRKALPNSGKRFDPSVIGAAQRIKPIVDEMIVDKVPVEFLYEDFPWAPLTLKSKMYAALQYLATLDHKYKKFQEETLLDASTDESCLILRYYSTMPSETPEFKCRKRNSTNGKFYTKKPPEDWRTMVQTIVETLEDGKAKQIKLENAELSDDDKNWLSTFFLDLDEFTLHCDSKNIFIAKTVKQGEKRITIQ